MNVEEALVKALNEDLIPDDADRLFARVMAERSASMVLTPKQRRASYRLLDRVGVQCDDPSTDGPPVAPTKAQLKPQKNGVSLRYVADGDRIAMLAPFRYKDVCKAMAGRRWHPEQKYWSVPATPIMADQCLRTFQGADADEHVQALAAQIARTAVSHDEDDESLLEPIPVTHTEPWRHQLRAFNAVKDAPAAMLAMWMGTGKSKVTVDLLVNNEAERVLIQCPKNVLGVWARELRTHAPGRFHVEVLTDGRRSIAQRQTLADELLHECGCGRPHVLVINYEAAWQKPFGPWALDQEWSYVIFDESHRIKAPGGTMSKFCAKLRQASARALALSGTPMSQSPLDIWGQYRALDPSIFGPSHTSFKYRYAIMGGWQGKEVIGLNPAMEEELARLYFSIAFEVGADVLDLPEAVDVERKAKLEPKSYKIYKNLEHDLYAEIADDAEVTVPNVLVKILRLQQLTGGVMRDDDGNEHEVGSEKADLLRDVLEDVDVADQPVVVFCRFVHDLDVVQAACEKLGYRYGELAGRRSDLTADAKMPEDVDVMGVQIQAGGVGIDLTRAKIGIYYSVGHSLSDYEQSRSRLVRPGQTGSALFIHLTCEGTIDEEVYEALSERQQVIDRVLDRGR